MREENRSEIIHDALNLLDDEMIEEVDRLRGGVVGSVSHENDIARKKTKLTYSWRKWATLAASVCLLFVAANVWELLQENVVNIENHSGSSNQANDGIMEESIKDMNQSGMIGMSTETEGDKCGVQDCEGNQSDQQKDYETNLGKPHASENESDEKLVKLQNYTAVYFSEVKNQNPSDDGMVQLSEEECEILVKFLDSMQRGTSCVVDAVSQSEMMNKADGQLVFELEDGTRFYLILIADGMVCSAETPNVWIQMDKRVYRILIDNLKENS